MNLPHAATNRPFGQERLHEADTRLHGRWLLLARMIWLALVVLTLGVCMASLPDYFTELQTVCRLAACSYGQLSPERALALQHFGFSVGSYALFMFALATLVALVFCGTGGVIFWRKSDDWMALLFALGLVLGGMFSILATLGSSHSVWRLPISFVGEMLFLLFFLAFTLFPDGRFVPRWTRWLFVAFSIESVVFTFFTNPFTAPLWIGVPLVLLFFSLYAGLVIAQMYRYRYVSTLVQRQQTKWVVYGFTANIAVVVAGFLPALIFPRSLYPLVFTLVFNCTMLLYPLTMGIAILRYRLWDIDVLINRTLVYTALSACVIGLYVLIVVGLGSLLQAQGNLLLSLLATGLIAILLQPLRQRLQRAVNRLLYGERDDPYAVLARLSSRLEATLVPGTVLPTIVETVAQTLKLPYVAIVLLPEQHPLTATAAGIAGAMAEAGAEVPDVAASYGTPTPDPVRVPLVYQAETIGYLLFAARAGETFGKTDARLLADLARQAGVAVYAVRLTASLQRLSTSLQESRERLVTTREEERRRLRRDLHDGLGPTLASLTFKVDAARNLLTQDNERAETLLAAVRQQAQEAISEIRRLVYNLRPPALDELGLLSALREQVALYQHEGLEVAFDVPGALPHLPAAVEVAAYRIAQEALTNVARHAEAQQCLLRLAIDAEAVYLDIGDDGVGIPAGHRIGAGLHTMHERASELGGSCTITEGSCGGTTIRVRFPLAKARDVFLSATQEPGQQKQESPRTPDMNQVRQRE